MTQIVRKNIRMSQEVAKYYEDRAAHMGVSQSALMVMALTDYIKQEKTIDMISNMEYMTRVLERKEAQE